MIGIDEVGRGAWAGPLLVVAARVHKKLPASLADSKLLSKKQRENIMETLVGVCDFGEGWVSASEIDEHGLSNAMRLGVQRALDCIDAEDDEMIILDGSVNYVDSKFLKSKCLVKADQTVPVVSAASIYAKVTRDEFMNKLGQEHKNYGFDKHVGYGTAVHKVAMQKHGVLKDIHRFSYRPVQGIASGQA